MEQVNIEEIVKQVLSEMKGSAGSQAAAPARSAAPAGAIPKTSRVAMLTGLENYDIKEYPIPELGDDDILVKVEGCGVCGTDAHEFKRDPFGLIPVVLGHEGTGEIVKMGKNVKVDSAGKPLALGDKVVTCMIFKDNPDITMFDLNKQNVGGADVYGLLPDDDIHLNGWFADYLVVRGGSSIFNVSDLDQMCIRDSYDEACAKAYELAEEYGYTFIHPFDDLAVATGQGTIAMEIVKELPLVDYILVPVGGGGLATGVSTLAKLLNPKIQVIGVEPAGANCLQESIKAGKVVSLPAVNTIADGTAVKTPGSNIFPFIQQNLDDIITVEDDELVVSFLDMVENQDVYKRQPMNWSRKRGRITIRSS